MLIFLRHNLTYVANPKTGTTAVEIALKSRAEIIFTKNRKHITASRYVGKVAPFIADTFGTTPITVAAIREPVDQIRSWYRYRSQSRLDGAKQSTKGVSFDQYVREVISDDPPPRARLGQQFNFLTDGVSAVLVDHLFTYENQTAFLMFMSERLEHPVEINPTNVSPKIDADLTPQTLALLRKARAHDFILYDEVMSSGGHLHTPQE